MIGRRYQLESIIKRSSKSSICEETFDTLDAFSNFKDKDNFKIEIQRLKDSIESYQLRVDSLILENESLRKANHALRFDSSPSAIDQSKSPQILQCKEDTNQSFKVKVDILKKKLLSTK